jgi:predicted  nucleic acid-binding Zn-ribbon protein
MMRKLMVLIGSLTVATCGLFVVSSRSVSELTGYFRATADTTVDNLTQQIPDAIHDRKLETELQVARQQLIDRQVDLNLSRSQVEQLRQDVTELDASVARRQRLLAEAYPVMKTAVARNQASVRFASTDFSLGDFQKEVDDLMTLQDRESRQREIKRDGLARLEKSWTEGERALNEMRTALEGLDQQVAVLRSRRDQAQVESATLDLISSATAGRQTVAANVSQTVDRLQHDVQKIEARNEARRSLAPADARPGNQVGRAWSRLEALKTYHDAESVQSPASAEADRGAEKKAKKPAEPK